MPRSEARIFTSIWKDPDFLALEPGAQRLYMFLLSQEDLTYCGTMPLRVPRWARKSSGLTVADIELDLKRLEGTAYPSANPDGPCARQPFVITDSDTGELLIRSMMRRDNAWKQPNLLKQAREAAEQIESPRIRGVLLTELRRLPVDDSPSEQVRTLVAEFIADLDQGSPYPSAYPPDYPQPNSWATLAATLRLRTMRARGSLENVTVVVNVSSKLLAPWPQLICRPRRENSAPGCPTPFPVTAEMIEWVRQNCPHVDAQRETERFEDYWRGKAGKDGRKLDWVATWRNWMRTSEDRQGPATGLGRREPSSKRPRICSPATLSARPVSARRWGNSSEPGRRDQALPLRPRRHPSAETR